MAKLVKIIKKYHGKYKVCFLFFLSFLCFNCTEEFEPKTEFFESALVIESVITNEVKQQEVLLSKTFRFDEENLQPEINANVYIIDNDQNEFDFMEVEAGRYLSVNTFGAISGKEYTLTVETEDGTRYNSDSVMFKASGVTNELYAINSTNSENVEGISLMMDSFDPSGDSQYYRFIYEETYKIIAPYWVDKNAEVDGNLLTIGIKNQEEETCYNTVASNSIILTNTAALAEDRISGFQLRFIGQDDYIIAHRYSILVKQYTISNSAYSYFLTLAENSGSESIFSENQPGFVEGNISVENDAVKKVIGYFEISTVNTKRIFFNHEDFFPDDFTDSFAEDCKIQYVGYNGLLNGILNNTIKYMAYDDFAEDPEMPYRVVSRPCGDCTALGSNIVPDFWKE